MPTNACKLPFSLNRDIVHARVKKGLTLPAIEQIYTSQYKSAI